MGEMVLLLVLSGTSDDSRLAENSDAVNGDVLDGDALNKAKGND